MFNCGPAFGSGTTTENTQRVVISSDSPIPIQKVQDFDFGAVQTASTGSNFTALPSYEARNVTLLNNSGFDVEVRKVGTTNAPFPVLYGTGYTFGVKENANELELRRIDQSDTQVTVNFNVEY